MRLDELLRFAGTFFDERGVDYYVFGATAMNFWIPPRSTADLDAVLCIDKKRALKVVEDLRAAKFRIPSTQSRLLLEGRLIKLPLGESELDLKLATSSHDRAAFGRAKLFAAEGFRLRIAVPEDLILFKLQSWRRQDQADVERLLRARADLDSRYIEGWLDRIEERGGQPMRSRWNEIRSES